MAVAGAGPAGIAATLQLAKAGHEAVVFEPGRVGGNLWNAGFLENYPGFPGGITGHSLAELMAEQLSDSGAELRRQPVTSIRASGDAFAVVSGCEEEFAGAIVCTGTVPVRAGFPGEDALSAAGLLFYGIADIVSRYELGESLVIGGGESSMDMALSLAEAGSKVILLHRSEPRGVVGLIKAVRAEEGIELRPGTVASARTHGRKAVVSLGAEEMAFDQVIVAVGRRRSLPELAGIDPDCPPPAFRIAGDARHGGLGQTAMAVGDGVLAAMEAGREARR
jgi:thioredoxin reductase (NADPH)